MNNDCMCSEPRVNACAYGRIEAGIRELQRAQATRAVANCWQASVTDAGVLAVEMRRAHLRRRCVVMQIRQIRCADIGKHRSEEHTSELQSLMRISYAVLCLKKKK